MRYRPHWGRQRKACAVLVGYCTGNYVLTEAGLLDDYLSTRRTAQHFARTEFDTRVASGEAGRIGPMHGRYDRW